MSCETKRFSPADEFSRRGMLNPDGDSSESELDIDDWDSYELEWDDEAPGNRDEKKYSRSASSSLSSRTSASSEPTPVDESQWSDSDREQPGDVSMPLSSDISKMEICSQSSLSSPSSQSSSSATGGDQEMHDVDEEVIMDVGSEEVCWTCSLCYSINKLIFLRCAVCHTAAPRAFGRRPDGSRTFNPEIAEIPDEINKLVRESSAARADYDIANLSREIEDMENSQQRIQYECDHTESMDPTDLRLQCHRLADSSTLCRLVHTQINRLDAEQLSHMRCRLIRSGIIANLYPTTGLTVEIPTTSGGWCLVFSFLDFETLITSVAFVNRKWSELSRHPASTTDLCISSVIARNLDDIKIQSLLKRRWTHLESADISLTRITIVGLQQLFDKSPSISSLRLGSCRSIDPKELNMVSQLTQLTELDISNTEIELETFQKLIDNCPKLIQLNLSACRKLTGPQALESLCKSSLKLNFLDMNSCGGSNVAIASDISSSKFWRNLEYLDLSYSETASFFVRIQTESKAVIEAIAANCAELKFLGFGRSVKLTDGLIRILTGVTQQPNGSLSLLPFGGCRQLMYLTIDNAKKLTEKSAKDLSFGCQMLRKVRLKECRFGEVLSNRPNATSQTSSSSTSNYSSSSTSSSSSSSSSSSGDAVNRTRRSAGSAPARSFLSYDESPFPVTPSTATVDITTPSVFQSFSSISGSRISMFDRLGMATWPGMGGFNIRSTTAAAPRKLGSSTRRKNVLVDTCDLFFEYCEFMRNKSRY